MIFFHRHICYHGSRLISINVKNNSVLVNIISYFEMIDELGCL